MESPLHLITSPSLLSDNRSYIMLRHHLLVPLLYYSSVHLLKKASHGFSIIDIGVDMLYENNGGEFIVLDTCIY